MAVDTSVFHISITRPNTTEYDPTTNQVSGGVSWCGGVVVWWCGDAAAYLSVNPTAAVHPIKRFRPRYI